MALSSLNFIILLLAVGLANALQSAVGSAFFFFFNLAELLILLRSFNFRNFLGEKISASICPFPSGF